MIYMGELSSRVVAVVHLSRKAMRFCATRRRGITLAELLVVLGLIAVLIALLLPVLGKVRRQANVIKCSARLRQLGAAIGMYVNENRGRLPFGYDGLQRAGPVFWFEPVSQYLGFGRAPGRQLTRADYAKMVCDCPEWEGLKYADDPFGAGLGHGDVGTVYNAEPSSPIDPGNGLGVMWQSGILAYKGPRYYKVTEITYRAERGQVFDGDSPYAIVGWDVRPDGMSWTPFPHARWVGLDLSRHGARSLREPNGSNVLFFDGHVALLSPADTMYALNDPTHRWPESLMLGLWLQGQ